jgi:hypothetical protein
MVTNRQRCLLIGKNLLRQHQIIRQESIQSTQTQKQKRKICNFCGILQSIDLVWRNCRHNACTIKYCPTCHENLSRHEEVCGKKQRR